MPYSLEQQLRLIGSTRFEELCGQLVGYAFAPAPWGHIEGRGGDEGIDIFVGELDSLIRKRDGKALRVWQVKWFCDGIRASQRKKIERSLLRVLEAHTPDFWTLCLPVSMNIAEYNWFASLKANFEEAWPDLRIESPWLGEEIIRRCLEVEGIVKTFFLLESSPISEPTFSTIVSRLDSFESVPMLLERASPKKSAVEFYNGTVPDWSDILAAHDANREITGDIWKFLRDRAQQEAFGRLPLAVITGNAMDGKSTVLMRLAHELVSQGMQLTFFHKSGVPLDADQFLTLRISNENPLFLLIDSISSLEAEEIEVFLERLHRISLKVIILATALTSVWAPSRGSLDNVAEIREFDLSRLSDLDAEALLDKLSSDPERAAEYLGSLADLSREGQLAVIQKKTDSQLGVILLEAKHNTRFEAYVLRELERLTGRFGPLVRRASVYVSAFHRFDVGIPRSLLQKLMPTMHIQDDLLRATEGFIGLSDAESIVRMRHPFWAEIVFRNAAKHDEVAKSWYAEILTAAAPDKIEDLACCRVLKAMALRSERELAYKILCLRDWNSVPLLHMLSVHHKKFGNSDAAIEVLRRALKFDSEEPRIWLALAQIEGERGNVGSPGEEFSARWLFRRASEIETDQRPVYTWFAWALMEAKLGNLGYQDASQLYTARWLFQKATESDPRLASPWCAWASLEAERGNLGDLTKRGTGKSVRSKYSAREILRRASQETGGHPSVWRSWVILEQSVGNFGTSWIEDVFSARWLYSQLLRVEPNNSVSWRSWAIIEKQAGNIGPCREDWSHDIPMADCFNARWMFWRGIVADPMDAATWQAWGMLEKEQKNWGNPESPVPYTARWLFRKASEVDPELPHSYTGWALVEEEDHRYEIAAHLFEQGANRGTRIRERSISYVRAAIASEKCRNWAEHERLLRKAIEIDELNLVAHTYLGRLFSFQGEWNEAEQHFQLVGRLDPEHQLNNVWFQEMRAFREKQRKNWPEAEQLFLDAAVAEKNLGKKSQMYSEAAVAAGRCGERAKQKRYLQLALKANNNSVYALRQMVTVLKNCGKYEEATEYLKRLLALDPDNDTGKSWFFDIGDEKQEN